MAIVISVAPPEVTEVLEGALLELHDARLGNGLGMPAPVSTTPLFPLLVVPGAQVAEGNWLGGLHQVGWRSVVEFEDGSCGLADVAREEEQLALASLSRGARTQALLAAAESLGDGEGSPDVELAVLWVPEVRLSAFYLRGEGVAAFLPFEGLESGVVSTEDFLLASRDYAREFRAGMGGKWTDDEFDGRDDVEDGGGDEG